ncbi:radical SAM protein [Flavobacterium filum]|uniref:radical SAM protein n=1 Tax=Flavobacterium filum TaxID=370974 RepID=UPI0023F4FB93|nr:radical SAM protein [Flavobacterium filum]
MKSKVYELNENDKIGFASLYVTSVCHLKCIHCHAEESFTGLISKDARTEQLIQIINKLSLITNRIQLTGGEIMMRRDPFSMANDVPFLVAEIDRRDKETIFQTTGMHFTPQLIDWIVSKGVKWVSLSLDGPDIYTNNIIRKVDKSFSKVVDVIPFLKEAGLLVKVGTVVTELNSDLNKIIQLGELLKNLNVDNWKLIQFFPRTAGRASNENKDSLAIENEKFDDIVLTIKKMFSEDIRISYHTLNDFQNTPALLVQPNGLVTVTVGNNDSLIGNLLTNNFNDFLNQLRIVKNEISKNELKTY